MSNENAAPAAPEATAGNPTPNPTTPDPKASAAAPAPEQDTRSWLPERLRGQESLKKFKTLDDALAGYVNLEGAFGKKFEEHLKEDAAPEIKSRVKAAMGVPDSIEGYEAPAAPEGYQLDKDLVSRFQKIAHDSGLSKSAWKKLSDSYVQLELDRMTQRQADAGKSQEAGMAELHKRWGAGTARNVALVQKVVSEYGGA